MLGMMEVVHRCDQSLSA